MNYTQTACALFGILLGIGLLAGGSPTAATAAEGLPPITAMKKTPALKPDPNATKFTFVVFGDNRPGAKGDPQPATVGEIFSEMKKLKPAFALSLGDIVRGKPKPSTDPKVLDKEYKKIAAEFKEFLDLAKTSETPLFNAPGNHEMDDHNDVPSARMHQLYRDNVAPTYGAFTYGNTRFVCLNSEDVPAAGTAKADSVEEFSYMSKEQLDQLAADLDANANLPHIVLAMHYPVRPFNPKDALDQPGCDRLQAIIKSHKNIAYVLASHEHMYYNPDDPNNVATAPSWKPGDPTRYLISGGAGAPLKMGKDSMPLKGSFNHYLVFEVNGDSVSVTIHKLTNTGAKE